MLATQSFGTDTALPPIVIVHGLFGSGRNWRAIAKRLAETRAVVTVDLRNHGASPRAATQSYPDMAGDLAEVVAGLGGVADLLGHSMGGKAAMLLALTRPHAVRRLVVADIAPVGYDHGDSHRALIAAMRRLDPARFATRGEADRALATEIESPAIRAFLLQSLDLKAHRWRLNLDVLDAEMDKILAFPPTDAHFDGPVLFLAGGNSDYLRPEYRATIKALFPDAHFARLPGAGHWLHAERPREFVEVARGFLGSGTAQPK